jgi:hypothetical protein
MLLLLAAATKPVLGFSFPPQNGAASGFQKAPPQTVRFVDEALCCWAFTPASSKLLLVEGFGGVVDAQDGGNGVPASAHPRLPAPA